MGFALVTGVQTCALPIWTSQLAAEALRKKGVDASSFEGGMKAWSTAWNIARKKFDDFDLWQIRRTGKGCLSYIIASQKEAIVIDASLPVEIGRASCRKGVCQ